MRKRLTVFAALFVLVAATPAISSAASFSNSTEVRPRTILTGRVVDQSGAPIADAIVAIVAPGTTAALVSVRTDSEGKYSITTPAAAGDYSVRVISIGFTPAVVSVGEQGTIRMRTVTFESIAQ
jgi:Flp pilus assembly protein TadG